MFPVGLNKFWQRISKSLYQTDANTLEQRNGKNAQAAYVYNTYTDASNYERAVISWASNELTIGTGKAGSGASRRLNLVGLADITLVCSGKSHLFDGNGGFYAYGPVFPGGTASTSSRTSFVTNSVIFGKDIGDVLITRSPRNNDAFASASMSITAGAASPTATTNITGDHLYLTGGAGASSSSAAAHGGSIALSGGAAYGTGVKGIVTASRLRADGLATSIADKTANYTLTPDDTTVTADATGGAVTLTLPAVSGCAGRLYVLKRLNSGANNVTVAANAAETMDGSNTVTLSSQYSTLILQGNAAGTTWLKLAVI